MQYRHRPDERNVESESDLHHPSREGMHTMQEQTACSLADQADPEAATALAVELRERKDSV